MRALGRLYDIGPAFVPVDLNAAGATGLRVSLQNASGVSFVFFKAAGGAETVTLTLQEHSASSGGTSQNLAVITRINKKTATTLAGTETWTEVTQAAGATYVNTGDGAKQGIYVIGVDAAQLSDGFGYVSLGSSDPGSTAQLGACLAVLHDLEVQRKPANLRATLA